MALDTKESNMDGVPQSKTVGRSSESGKALTETRIKCQLCETPLTSTNAVSGPSEDEEAFTSSLKWLNSSLVRWYSLEEGDERLLNCSVANTCNNCKSSLKFAKTDVERAQQQYEKVKTVNEKFKAELNIFQEAMGTAIVNLKNALGLEDPRISQGELPWAITKVFEKFTELNYSSRVILGFLGSKFNENSGLFPFPNTGAENESESKALVDQDLQETNQVVNIEGTNGTGTSGEQNDCDVIESVITATAGCYVKEDNARNTPAVNQAAVASSGGSSQAANQILLISLESSDEERAAAADTSLEKSNERAPPKRARKKTDSKSLHISGSNINGDNVAASGEDFNRDRGRAGKKRKLCEDPFFASSKTSRNIVSQDVKSARMVSFPQTLTSSEAAQVPTVPAPAIAGPSKLARPCPTSSTIKMYFLNSKASVKNPRGNGHEDKQARLKRSAERTDQLNLVSAENWTQKLEELELSNKDDANTVLFCMAYLKPDYIQQNFLYGLPERAFKRKRKSVQENVDVAVKYLLKHCFIKKQKMDQETVINISPGLQSEIKALLQCERLEMSVLGLLVELLANLEQDSIVDEEQINKVVEELCHFLEKLKDDKKSLQEEGIKLGESVLESFRKNEALRSQHQNCFILEKIISILLYKVGKYALAAEKLAALSKKYANVLKLKGKDDDDLLLGIRAEQGEALILLGRYEEALTIQHEVLEKTLNAKGEEDVDTVVQENRYGRFLFTAGKFQEALKMFKSVEEKERKVKPQNIKLILDAQMNVANTYSKMGADEEALKVRMESYKTISSSWEENVELFAKISSNLGDCHLDMKNFFVALEHLSADYATVKGKLGDDSCWTQHLLQLLGVAYRGNGTDKKRLETALKMHTEAYQAFLAKNDQNWISAKNEMALDLSMLGQHDEALEIFKESISEYENLQEIPDRLMEYKLNYVEALERSGEVLEEVLRQLEAIKVELEELKLPRQIKRADNLLARFRKRLLVNK